MKKVNVYDFDHTIYNGDCSLDFIKHCLRHYPKTWLYLPTIAGAALRYAIVRNRKLFKQTVFSFLKVIPSDSLNKFWDTHDHKLKPWYLRIKKSDDVIITASPEFLLEPVAMKLGVNLIATRMNPKNGKITGENCRGSEKVLRLGEYASDTQVENFYTDHPSDAPMASIANNAYLVRGSVVTVFEPPQ